MEFTEPKSSLVPLRGGRGDFIFEIPGGVSRSQEECEILRPNNGLGGGGMIGGSDTVLVCCGDAREPIDRFLERRLRDWPGMRVSVSEVSSGRFRKWTEFRSQLPQEGEILVARDETMEAAWDEMGYMLDPEGEGPFAIYYETVKRTATPIKALADPYDRAGFRFEPYELTLAGRGLHLVTLVTPDLESQFSRLLVDSFVTALGS